MHCKLFSVVMHCKLFITSTKVYIESDLANSGGKRENKQQLWFYLSVE